MKNFTFAIFLSLFFGCDAPVDSDLAGAVSSRSICEDVPEPGTPGGACYVGYECDAGLTCKVGTVGFVCAAPCGTTTGCDCGTSCDAGLCETQCKSTEDCAEGMVCDSYGTGAAVCVWPALVPQPDPAGLCEDLIPGERWAPCLESQLCNDGLACAQNGSVEVCVPSCQFAACPEANDACDFDSACSTASRCLPLCEGNDDCRDGAECQAFPGLPGKSVCGWPY